MIDDSSLWSVRCVLLISLTGTHLSSVAGSVGYDDLERRENCLARDLNCLRRDVDLDCHDLDLR